MYQRRQLYLQRRYAPVQNVQLLMFCVADDPRRREDVDGNEAHAPASLTRHQDALGWYITNTRRAL